MGRLRKWVDGLYKYWFLPPLFREGAVTVFLVVVVERKGGVGVYEVIAIPYDVNTANLTKILI